MVAYCIFGRRHNDFGLMIDFRRERAIVKTNTSWIEGGIYLEEIPPGQSQFKPGMVLMKRDWNAMYFMNEREGWEEEEYFKFAEKRMKEMDIRHP